MFFNSKKMIFLASLIISTIMVISSSSWFTAWVGLEINLMSMAPILVNKMNYPSAEATIKYFLIQAVASSLMMFFICTSYKMSQWNLNNFSNEILMLTLMTKTGVAPLHFWFPQVVSCSEWPQALILLTWQKIAPLVLISYILSFMIYIGIFITILVGMIGAINQTSMKNILIYSSFINLAWLISLIVINEIIWWVFIVSYFSIMFAASYLFIQFNMVKLSSIYKMELPLVSFLVFFVNMFSLIGLPPFLGFFLKMMSLLVLIKMNTSILLLSVLILSSVVSFFFYVRVTFSSLMIIVSSKILKIPSMQFLNKKTFHMFNMISLTGMSITPLLVCLI